MYLINFNREIISGKSVGLEQEARQAEEQLTELARSLTWASNWTCRNPLMSSLSRK
jgi:hypothetical protein